MTAHSLQRFLSVRAASQHLEVALQPKDLGKPLQHNAMVVGEN